MKKKREEKNTYSTVSLPSPLVEKIKKTIKNTGYVSVSDFVTDVLRTVLVMKDKKVYPDVKKRLEALGYL